MVPKDFCTVAFDLRTLCPLFKASLFCGNFLLQLEFEVVGAGGKDSCIAIDDIFLAHYPCENQGLTCLIKIEITTDFKTAVKAARSSMYLDTFPHGL